MVADMFTTTLYCKLEAIQGIFPKKRPKIQEEEGRIRMSWFLMRSLLFNLEELLRRYHFLRSEKVTGKRR